MVTAGLGLLELHSEQLSHPIARSTFCGLPEVLEVDEIQSVDVAFVDEGQDSSGIEFLDALDQAVVGGLDRSVAMVYG